MSIFGGKGSWCKDALALELVELVLHLLQLLPFLSHLGLSLPLASV